MSCILSKIGLNLLNVLKWNVTNWFFSDPFFSCVCCKNSLWTLLKAVNCQPLYLRWGWIGTNSFTAISASFTYRNCRLISEVKTFFFVIYQLQERRNNSKKKGKTMVHVLQRVGSSASFWHIKKWQKCNYIIYWWAGTECFTLELFVSKYYKWAQV